MRNYSELLAGTLSGALVWMPLKLLAARTYATILNMNASTPPITIDPQRRGGRACVRDLRISVGDVLGWLASGMTQEQVVADYPELTQADIRACLAYAAARESHELRLSAVA